MTLAQANAIFKTAYPKGEIFAHGYGDGSAESTSNQRTALIFNEGGKVYVYHKSYEKTLKHLGLIKANKSSVIPDNKVNDDNDDFWAKVYELNQIK